ncbi:LPS-assembly protein LptD, partial [Psychrobacter sp. 1U2]
IFNGSYLPNDRKYDGEDRSSFFYDHYWSSSSIPRLSGDAKYSYVSDEDYLNDFDTLGLSDSTVNLPRRARLNYYNDYVNGELKLETFQTLDAFDNDGDALEDKDKPYSRLPQLSLNYRLPWLDAFDITGVHDSAYFKKSIDDGSEDEKSGIRVYNKLSTTYPIEAAWGYVKPKLSLQHLYTSYDQDSLEDNQLNKEDGSQSVFVPQASIDAGLHLYRAGSPFGAFDDTMGGYQLLSPRLKYTYSPFEDQNDIPNFNTRIASINYEQLFSDSWFLGHDRLQDLHAITPGINYRYIDATGVTRFDGSIAEQFYYGDGRVNLDDQTPVFNTSSSGMVWNASAQPYNNVWVDVSGALNNSYDINYLTTELRYQPSNNSLFN